MKSPVRVAALPAKPLLVYDGDCRFCIFWIRRWQHTTGDRVEYLAFQDPRIATDFPELPREQCESAVQLIEPDGQVFSGAEAALRALATAPHHDWLLDHYYDWPPLAALSERIYAFVARHRTFFSFLTRLGWGNIESWPPAWQLSRWVFLRALGLVYLAAFVSLWVQIAGLVGERGIIPAQATLEVVRQQIGPSAGSVGLYAHFPTLCWFNAGDSCLQWQCAAGTFLALLVIVGIAPAPCLFLLWLVYLSLATVCSEFLGFQWDNLLLETGLVAVLLAPLQLWPRASRAAPPSRIALWLLKWLLFRLMFESGCVKLLSHDPTWRNLTALTFHYETQPLPTWIGWYAHQLPASIQKASVFIMFGIETIVPFFIFAPRRPRHAAAVVLIALQVVILLTGNYCFFNWLTIALCLLLFDDQALRKCFRLRLRFPETSKPILAWQRLSAVALLLLTLILSLMQLSHFFGLPFPWSRPLVTAQRVLAPFRSWNSYGLFAVMTTSRPEIVIEGSDDGKNWQAYEFKYKPGDMKKRPGFVAPHQPRLDWQMWFAALGNYQQNPWLINFCVRLLQGSPDVLPLLEQNPFPNTPPRYIRALVYEYRFTDWATRRATGAWWRRELKGLYMPVGSLPEGQAAQK